MARIISAEVNEVDTAVDSDDRSGKVSATAGDLWYLGRELGRAGKAALAELAASKDPAFTGLQEDIARLEAASNRYQFVMGQRVTETPDYAAQIRAAIIVRPEGASAPEDWLDGIEGRQLEIWASSCADTTPAGHPGCLLLMVDLLPQDPGPEAIFARLTGPDSVALSVIRRNEGALRNADLIYVSGSVRDLRPEVLDQIRAGQFRLEPVTLPAVSFGPASDPASDPVTGPVTGPVAGQTTVILKP
jgi:hypothetical protein